MQAKHKNSCAGPTILQHTTTEDRSGLCNVRIELLTVWTKTVCKISAEVAFECFCNEHFWQMYSII